MAFKEKSYKVEAINMQNKVACSETFNTRTLAEIYGDLSLKESKVKLIKINGKIWKKKGRN